MHISAMHIKKGLLILLFVILMGSAAFASTNNIKRVFISEDFILSDITENSPEQFFFFFCDGVFVNSETNNVYLFFSNVAVNENVSGVFKCFFSEISIDKSAGSNIKVNTFLSKITAADELGAKITRIFDWMKVLERTYSYDGITVVDDTIHPVVLKLLRLILLAGIFSMFLSVRKSFFEQGGFAVIHESGRILKSGLPIYFIFVCSTAIFMLFVFGVVISFFLLIALIALVLIGYASLSLSLGRAVVNMSGFPGGTYLNIIIGMVLLEALNFIPYVQIVSNFLLIPIISLGIVYVNFMNMYVSKNFY